VQTEDTSFKSYKNLNKMFCVFFVFVAWENMRKQDVGTHATLSRFATWEGKQTGLSGGACHHSLHVDGVARLVNSAPRSRVNRVLSGSTVVDALATGFLRRKAIMLSKHRRPVGPQGCLA
jgi:hypothetical protein